MVGRIPEIQRLQLPPCFLCDLRILLIFRPLSAKVHPLSDLSASLLLFRLSKTGLARTAWFPVRGWLRNFHKLCKHRSLWHDILLFLFTHPSIFLVSFRIASARQTFAFRISELHSAVTIRRQFITRIFSLTLKWYRGDNLYIYIYIVCTAYIYILRWV